mmetsp:Transcript_86839/g.172389  ORF Transcript_86839/g.172389 Transcript_86839/m.172389 type:complete len:410 (-) Transcript_86839:453-1682(-)
MLSRTLAGEDFPNGAVIFCSNELLEVMHPPQSVHGQTVLCDECFDTSMVQEALRVHRELTDGVVLIDGKEAALGTMLRSESAVSKLAHLSSNIASRTRRGGQSAARYIRNRDAEEMAFLRKVAEAAREAFGEVRGLVVGGRGDMKRKLIAEFAHPLRGIRTSVVDLHCYAEVQNLQKMTPYVSQAFEADLHQRAELEVGHFLELVAQTESHATPLVCYGEAETLAALRMDVVDQLLVPSDSGGLFSSSNYMWVQLAEASGASLVEVDPRSQATLQFCRGFGVGARLRYQVDPALFEKPDSEDVSVPADLQKLPAVPNLDSDSESISTSTSRTDNLLIKWLQDALKEAMQDTYAAESLALCADLVLSDESTPAEERLEGTVDMLRAEGVPEDMLLVLACHIADHFSIESA